MAPILGIWASSKLPAVNAGSFESIATVTVGAGGSSSVTFSSIPQTYTHLQLRIFVKGAYGYLVVNSDTSTTYRRHYLYGDGASAGAGSDTNTAGWDVIDSSNTANIFAANIVDILDYTNTNKNKVARILRGVDFNGSGAISLLSGLYPSTSAISSLTVTAHDLAGSFVQYSSFALYGIKGS